MSFYLNLRKGDTTNVTAKVTRTDGKPFTVAKIKPSQIVDRSQSGAGAQLHQPVGADQCHA